MNRGSDKHLLGDIFKILLIVAFFSCAAYLLDRPDVREIFFDIDEIILMLKRNEDIHRYFFSIVIFFLAGTLVIALGVPRLWVTVAWGGIYGVLIGSIVTLLSSLLGALVFYLAGKTMLAAIVERRFKNRLLQWKNRFRKNAFWWVLYGRLFPFSNSTVMSLICGSCNLPVSPFIWGSLIGFIPLILVFAIYGSGGTNTNHWQIAIATILLILSFFSRKLLPKWFHMKNVGDDIKA